MKNSLFLFLLFISPAFADLVDLKEVSPNILIDLRYATSDNFTGQIIYDFSSCLVQRPVATQLDLVQKELEKIHLGLKVWDGYRPMYAQWKFWEIVPDERYVSNPTKGGRHTRGTAVDLTLVTLDGKELPMPTAFDDFTEKAHRAYMELPQEVLHNRSLLQTVMEKHGFIGMPTEWWHFDLVGWEEYDPIEDFPENQLSKMPQ